MDISPVFLIQSIDVSVELESGVDYLGIESIFYLLSQTMQSPFSVEQNDSLFHYLPFRVDLVLEGIECHPRDRVTKIGDDRLLHFAVVWLHGQHCDLPTIIDVLRDVDCATEAADHVHPGHSVWDELFGAWFMERLVRYFVTRLHHEC